MELLDRNGLTEAEYLASYRVGDYERPSVTADVAVFRETPVGHELLLIRRGGHPFLGKDGALRPRPDPRGLLLPAGPG